MRSSVVARTSCAVVALLAMAGSAQAAALNVGITNGSRAAEATFDVQGSNLIVTLTNTSTADVVEPVFVLTAIFFDITGPALSLTRASAVLNAGSVVINDPPPAGGVVGGEWAFKAALSGAPHGADYGIGSAGFNLFGPGDLFPGPDLEPPTSPNGLEYGITSAGDNPATDNGGTNTPLIKNSVVFTLSGLPSGFDPQARITNISFQYGTGLDEPNFLVPAPGSAAFLTIAALAATRRRRAGR